MRTDQQHRDTRSHHFVAADESGLTDAHQRDGENVVVREATPDGTRFGEQRQSMGRLLVAARDGLRDQQQPALRARAVDGRNKLVSASEPPASERDLAPSQQPEGQPERTPGRVSVFATRFTGAARARPAVDPIAGTDQMCRDGEAFEILDVVDVIVANDSRRSPGTHPAPHSCSSATYSASENGVQGHPPVQRIHGRVRNDLFDGGQSGC